MIDDNLFNKFESAGSVERIRKIQSRTLDNILDFGRMARMIENETLKGKEAYNLIDMMRDLRRGVWSEVYNGRSIDTYRRNLQRAYIDRMGYLMTKEQSPIPPRFRRWITRTNVNVKESDIRPVVRAELKTIQRSARAFANNSSGMKRIHLQDIVERIEAILNPK